ncbi:MAG TPA: glycoside hydrolase family 30 beta sandwich domain-containing protein [Terriglobales bacterium]|nr:glycoside hydrolase family 30 beta sandwich domain-containing protein [Terriglobales bacterium]
MKNQARCTWVRSSRSFLLCGWLLWILCSTAAAQDIRLYVSSKAGDRLTAKSALRFAPRTDSGAANFEINDTVTYQKMDGFGASFLEAGLICINSLPAAEQEAVLRALFDPKEGAGFSAMKTVIASTDFMSAGPFYSYDPVAGDVEMKHFSIARDLGPNGLITFIKRARRYGSFVLQAPMDYPPDWMLVDPDANQNVNPKYYDALAHYYLRYLQEYEKNGITIDYLSLFNEPGIYTKIPYSAIRNLLRDHVGPLLAKSGLRTKIMLSEAPDREDAYKNYPVVLDDPAARKYVALMPYHGYDFKDYAEIAKLHERYPDLPLWMTEVCYAYEAGTPKSMPLPRYDFEDGDFWGTQIFNDLETFASAWIYWNMALDEHGGPWSVSYIHGNPDPNIQHPVVIIDRQKKEVTYTGLYYYLAHFSRFVRPGAVRVQTSGSQPGVRAMAFQGPDGGMVLELMNSGKNDTDVNVSWHGRQVRLNLPAISIMTALWKK